MRGRERRGERPLECEISVTCVPNFDRPIVGAGDDGLAVRRESDGRDRAAVGALLARLELQST